MSDEATGEYFWQLARLNTVADKYDIRLLRDGIVDELYKLHKKPNIKPPQISVITYVYANTRERSSFRKLMVAWYAWLIDCEWYDHDSTCTALASVHRDFSIDLAMALGTRVKFPRQKSAFILEKSVYFEEPTDKHLEGSVQ